MAVGGPFGSIKEWRTLGTYAFLAVQEPRLLEAAFAISCEVLAALDRACSRFRHDSDLTRVNRSPGRWVAVDPLLVAATRVAVEAARKTDGLVDPCLGRTLVALGYDVDLHKVQARASAARQVLPPPNPDAWRDIGIDDERVRVPAGCTLDLGATAKAWAADLVSATIVERLGCGVLVSLGGDIRVDGEPPDPPWPVRVTERPGDPDGQLVGLDRGGLATSTTVIRRWRTDAGEAHHLIDPRTARPVEGYLRTVTATGRSCVAANVATTAAMVLGAAAEDWLVGHGVTARLVHQDGTVTTTGDWPLPQGDAA